MTTPDPRVIATPNRIPPRVPAPDAKVAATPTVAPTAPPEPEAAAPLKRRPYIVWGTNIKDADGNKIGHLGLAMLDLELATKYNDHGLLRPYIPESDDEPEPTESVDGPRAPKVR
jgi:hypothetical protein